MRVQSTDQTQTQHPAPRPRHRIGVLAATVGSLLLLWALLAPLARASFATQLTAEPGQTPMPNSVVAVPEDCKGIAPTSGSSKATTQKELNDGQGLVSVGPNSFLPGGTVHWLIRYNATDTAKSFDIRDCVVEFLPGNPNIAEVISLIDPNGHGQIMTTPGSTPAIKGYDTALDNAEFDFADNVALPGEFDLSWTVPADAPGGALICNYAKDTGGTHAGGNENRKAGACFTVQAPPTTTSTTSPPSTTSTVSPASTTSPPTTTSTEIPSTTSTTIVAPGQATTSVPVSSTTEASTSTTSPGGGSTTSTSSSLVSTPSATASVAAFSAATTTTVPTQVLGEQFNKLATTGGATRTVLTGAGALILMGGILVLASERRTRRPAR